MEFRSSMAVGAIALAAVLAGCSGTAGDTSVSAPRPTGAVSSETASSGTRSSAVPYPSEASNWSGASDWSGASSRSGASGWSASAPVVHRPPYIERVAWTETEVGPSLSVFPTTSGRYTGEPDAMAAAWAEVLALDPGAGTPGMQAQFDCHWRFARLVDPEKTSWNLEPERPVVTDEVMIDTRCNPGFAEE